MKWCPNSPASQSAHSSHSAHPSRSHSSHSTITTAIACTAAFALTACSPAAIPGLAGLGEPEAVTEARGMNAVKEAGQKASDRCARNATYTPTETAVEDSGFPLEQFHAAYVEDGGSRIRHVIVGATQMDISAATLNIGYLCGYVQTGSDNSPAAENALSAMVDEDASNTLIQGGEMYIELRDHLRDFHEVEANDDFHVFNMDFSDASDGFETSLEKKKSSRSSYSTESTDSTESSKPSPTTAPEPQGDSFTDGTHRVGTDIEPGTYRNDGSTGKCYWARLSGFSGSTDSILANDNPRGQTYVTIDPSDAAFKSSRCGTWEKVE